MMFERTRYHPGIQSLPAADPAEAPSDEQASRVTPVSPDSVELRTTRKHMDWNSNLRRPRRGNLPPHKRTPRILGRFYPYAPSRGPGSLATFDVGMLKIRAF